VGFSLLAAGLAACCGLYGQAASFEVASIKPSAPDVAGLFVQPQPGGGLRVTGATLKHLIAIAYEVREFQILSAPAWAGTERFDIDARAPRSPAPVDAAGDPRRAGIEIHERLRSLLAERFQLSVHREEQEQSVYALVVAKNGPRFSEATPDSGNLIRGGRGLITGRGTTMQMLALNLANQLGRQVLEKTGLRGKYDFKLEWTPDAGGVEAAAEPERRGPSLFTALQEQLGLRLESQKSPVPVLVIDGSRRPSEN